MKNKLDSYHKKRNFEKTMEPIGVAGRSGGKKRIFVVQHHLARRDHYDFRLEWEGVLLSFAVPKGPSFNPSDKRLAVMVEPHPLEYAEFEGTIPKGQYGGGTVMLWDKGIWTPLEDFASGLKNGNLKFWLDGERLKGGWALVKLKNDDDNWLLIKENDEFSQSEAGIDGFTTSIKTGCGMKEIEKGAIQKLAKNPFDFIEPKLALMAEQVPSGKDWLYEIKFDGYRMLAFVAKDRVRLLTRNNKDFTSKFAEIEKTLLKIAKGRVMVLDGEVIVANEEGKSDFQALQNHMRNNKGTPIYMVFDLLALDGEDLRNEPLIKRKKKLEQILKGQKENVCFTSHVQGGGVKFFDAVKKLGLEGVIAKKVNSIYNSQRDGEWVKVKCYNRQEFVVGGFTRSEKKQNGISALLLGVNQNGKLKYVGRSGTGFDQKTTELLLKKFKPLLSKKPPFSVALKKESEESVFYLKPNLVAEVQYAEFTRKGVLRQASFKGLREDKAPKDVVLEKADISRKMEKAQDKKKEKIELTSPDKVIFTSPRVTKLQVAQYYEKVTKHMLPFVAGRLLSVVRCHESIKDVFYKKHPMPNEDVETVELENSEGEKSTYFYIENARQLLGQVQLGTLEFHTWGSKANKLERPDYMVFDFDPDKKLSLDKVRQGVKDLKRVLDKLGLKAFLKTSGGKGYHVVVPFNPSASWETFHDFAESVAKFLEKEHPDRYTTNIRKERRNGKIFIRFHAQHARGNQCGALLIAG